MNMKLVNLLIIFAGIFFLALRSYSGYKNKELILYPTDVTYQDLFLMVWLPFALTLTVGFLLTVNVIRKVVVDSRLVKDKSKYSRLAGLCLGSLGIVYYVTTFGFFLDSDVILIHGWRGILYFPLLVGDLYVAFCLFFYYA